MAIGEAFYKMNQENPPEGYEQLFAEVTVSLGIIQAKLDEIDALMQANATNSVKLKELLEEREKTSAFLDEKMERWIYLNDLAERIAAEKQK